MMQTFIVELFESLRAPFGYLLDPTKRIYWGYSVAAIALVIVLNWRSEKMPLHRYLKTISSPSHWWNRSTQLDIQLLFINSICRVLILVPLIVAPLTIAVAMGALLEQSFGIPTSPALSRSTIAILYTFTLFVISDGSRYLVHRLFHEVPFLWRFHSVHHSATSLTPLTLYRIHPVEVAVQELRRAFAIGVTTGVFLYLCRDQLNGIDVLGVNLFGFLFNLTGANLRHSNTRISYGRLIEHVLISPAQHQVHHSVDPIHENKNYGSCLALWDWLGGSLVLASSRSKLVFGIPKNKAPNHSNALRTLFSPFFSRRRPTDKSLLTDP